MSAQKWRSDAAATFLPACSSTPTASSHSQSLNDFIEAAFIYYLINRLFYIFFTWICMRFAADKEATVKKLIWDQSAFSLQTLRLQASSSRNCVQTLGEKVEKCIRKTPYFSKVCWKFTEVQRLELELLCTPVVFAAKCILPNWQQVQQQNHWNLLHVRETQWD